MKWIWAMSAGLMLFGCEGDPPAKKEMPKAADSEPSPSEAAKAEGAAADVEIAVPADFAEEAAEAISPDNYKDALKALAEDIE